MSERTEQLKKSGGERCERLGFTRRATLFKRFQGLLNDSIHHRFVSFVADNVPANTRHALDVGCGYGRLPVLLWLPKPLSGLYLKILGRGDCNYETLHTYWALNRMCSGYEVTDCTTDVVGYLEKFGAPNPLTPRSLQQELALALLRFACWFSPGHIWPLSKPRGVNAGVRHLRT
jgi:hypothetical protein